MNPGDSLISHCLSLLNDIFFDWFVSVDEISTVDYKTIFAGTLGNKNTSITVVGRVFVTHPSISEDFFKSNKRDESRAPPFPGRTPLA